MTKVLYVKFGLDKHVPLSKGKEIFAKKSQNAEFCGIGSELELSHLQDLHDSEEHFPSMAEDFQLHPLCNPITKLSDAWCSHLWGRIRRYPELRLLHILGFNIEIMNGFTWTCMGWRFVEDKSGSWAVCHIYPAAKIQKINSPRSLNCLKSIMCMKLIDLDVLLLHGKWANTMIPF